MKAVKTTNVIVLFVFAAFPLVSGCTNWQQRYMSLSVEHENVKGLLENCRQSIAMSGSEKSTLAQQLTDKQRKINALQRQIAELNKTAVFSVGPGDRTTALTLSSEALFSAGKAQLKKTGYAELDRALSVLKQRYPGAEIDVVGHTDSDPIKKTKSKWKDNWELSAERALSVVRYLESQGIPGERLRAVGCGQSRPVASNASTAGKAKNRRVEIVVYMK